MNTKVLVLLAAFATPVVLVGHGGRSNGAPTVRDDPPKGPVRTFRLAWSESPSWALFALAADLGLINGEKGKLGTIEMKWNIDIELELQEHEASRTAYTAKLVDATCLTNMEALVAASARPSVAILPTSTSVGADACVVTGIKDVEELKKHKVYGLKESTSQWAFARILEKKFGKTDRDYQFSQMGPGEAARAMQSNVKGVDAIMVRGVEVVRALKARQDARVLFDSSAVPEEIIDLVVVGQDVLDKPGGDRFACSLIDTYHEMNKLLATAEARKDLLSKLGKKCFDLDAEEMARACEQSRPYKTPEAALKLFTGEQFPGTMKAIVAFWNDRRYLTGRPPTIGFGSKEEAKDAQLRFDPTYIQRAGKDR